MTDNMVEYSGSIVDNHHILPIRVYYEHVDLTGMVYHGNYVKWFEAGRSDFLRLLGLSHTSLLDRKPQIAWTITQLSLTFHRPAKIDDLLNVKTTYTMSKGPRLNAIQSISRGQTQLVYATVEAVCIGLDGKPKRIPKDIQTILEKVIIES